MRLRYLAAVFGISTLLIVTCTKEESVKVMPVTTGSELALEFYETGVLAFDQLKWDMARKNFEMSVKEDPNLFMSYLWMYFMSHKSSKKIAEMALQCDATLNNAEKQVKTAFKYLLDGQEEKMVEHMELAIDLYPSDPHLYKILYFVQSQLFKDMEGSLETILMAVKVQPGYASVYNYKGYAHMDMDEFGKAEVAFNNYIRLAPNTANPYDSKGDYYMATEQFKDAFESYMKAFKIDSNFAISEKKAKKAKYFMEKSME